jgi:hypothetical protein
MFDLVNFIHQNETVLECLKWYMIDKIDFALAWARSLESHRWRFSPDFRQTSSEVVTSTGPAFSTRSHESGRTRASQESDSSGASMSAWDGSDLSGNEADNSN